LGKFIVLIVKSNNGFLLKFTLMKVGAGMTNEEQGKNKSKVNIGYTQSYH